MAISAQDVKKLRDITGAGMMDCKKALTQANGDFAQAEKILKEMGLTAVAKRQDRATENGRVFVKTDGKKAVLLSLSCETDFVAKNKDFEKLGEDICSVVLEKGYTAVNDELHQMVNDLIAIIKENMALEKLVVVDVASYAATYIHGEGAVAVLVNLSSDKPEIFQEEDVKVLSHDLALHAAAFKPQFLNAESIDKAYEEEQRGIFLAQVEQDEKLKNKPEKVKSGIVSGKMQKLYSEICFEDQKFVKDDSKSVKEAIAEVAKKHDAKISIVNYYVFQAGVNG